MKRVFLLMIACCIFAAKGFGQTPNAEKKENPNAPEITFVETVHDFGTIPFKGVAECEFTFTNTGKEPLIIQECQSTCGCTTPTCPKDTPVKPGEKGVIKAKYNNTHIAGPFTKQFTVISNAKTAQVRITIKGEIAPNPEPEKPQATNSEGIKVEMKVEFPKSEAENPQAVKKTEAAKPETAKPEAGKPKSAKTQALKKETAKPQPK